jgi:hypothetical protein
VIYSHLPMGVKLTDIGWTGWRSYGRSMATNRSTRAPSPSPESPLYSIREKLHSQPDAGLCAGEVETIVFFFMWRHI